MYEFKVIVIRLKQHLGVTITLTSLCLGLLYSCCEEDVYHYLPSEAGRYYIENDTIIFYSQDTEEYETYIVCYEETGFPMDEISGTWCSHFVLFENHYFELFRDSCGSERFFRVRNNKNSGYISSDVSSFYSNEDSEIQNVNTINDFNQSFEIFGYTYKNLAIIEFSANDSLKSILYSIEYGIVQYEFENITYSLLRDENQ